LLFFLLDSFMNLANFFFLKNEHFYYILKKIQFSEITFFCAILAIQYETIRVIYG